MSNRWTPAQDSHLLHRRDVDHASIQDIARALGRTREACRARYALLHKHKTPDPIRAPIDLIADRDARYRLELTQPAAARAMGDPLPGRSALDMRGKQQ